VIEFLGTQDLLIVAGVIVLLVLIAARFLLHDREVKRTRFGFFVERDRYGDEIEDTAIWPPESRELPLHFKHDDTVELPPKEKP
jgi:hypothetical protein